ncbi:hypothetical protein [uncultured Kushneria sp.]|uniref:hypothetical protein n=1 Tax=uncultured Kushneria sp. TaxID=905033 RepID=UPI0026297DC0|nr:hypothetical protein [uncultured Kushneria sp.]
MSGDQASGLRQWSQAHALTRDVQGSSIELVVMTWHEKTATQTLARQLPCPEPDTVWQPRPLMLSLPLPGSVPASPWWVLHLSHLEARSAPALAEALCSLRHAGMPHTVLLAAPDHLAVAGLVSAARTHLGVRLLQDARAWHQAVMASPSPG